MPDKRLSDWLPYFLALVFIWGTAFWFIKLGIGFLDAYQVAFGRIGLGALALVITVIATRRRLITNRAALKQLAFVGFTGQALPFTLFAWAENSISSIAAGLMNSTMALWTALLAVAILPEEKLTKVRLQGLVIGFIGVLILLGVWQADFQASWTAYLACAIATASYGVAVLWMRKHVSPLGLDPVSAVAPQLSLGALMTGLAVVFLSSTPTKWPLDGVIAMLVLGVICTGAAFVINFELVRRAGAMPSAMVTYGTPIVSTFSGVLFLREQLHWYEPVGALVVLFGVAQVQGLIRKSKSS